MTDEKILKGTGRITATETEPRATGKNEHKKAEDPAQKSSVPTFQSSFK